MTKEFITSYEDQIHNEKTLYHWSCIGPVFNTKHQIMRWGAGIAAALPYIIGSFFYLRWKIPIIFIFAAYYQP